MNKLKDKHIFQCKICKEIFDCVDDRNGHITIHLRELTVVLTRTKIYRCSKCIQAFINQREYTLHRAKHVAKAVSEKLRKIKERERYPDVGEYIKPHKCPDCDAKFVQESTLEAHSVLHNPFPFVCFCGIGYYESKDLDSHMNLVKCNIQIKDKREDECLQNGYSSESSHDEKIERNESDSKIKLEVDIKSSSAASDDEDYIIPKKTKKRKRTKKRATKRPHFRTERVRTCKYCPSKFISLQLLQCHMDTHTELSHVCANTKCDERFLTLKELEDHIYLNHIFKCTVCNKFIASKAGLQTHMYIHTGERKYHCTLCDKSFTQHSSLNRHLMIHANIKDFKCRFCDKTFINKGGIKNHERIHTGEKPYVCKFCNKAFADKSAHTRHLRIHTGDYRYTCDICSKKFTDLSGLLGHKLRHGKKTKKCEMCNKLFFTNHDLKIHEKTHIRVKQYECDHCQKKFAQKANLGYHITRIHSQPFRCEHCSLTFTSKSRIENHIIKEHSIVLYCNVCLKKFYSGDAFSSHRAKKCYKSKKR